MGVIFDGGDELRSSYSIIFATLPFAVSLAEKHQHCFYIHQEIFSISYSYITCLNVCCTLFELHVTCYI